MTPEKKYQLTEEQKAQIGPWTDKWIANALTTEQMTEHDKALCREAVAQLYGLAKHPAPKSVVFVASPYVLRYASGFACALIEKYGKAAAKHTIDPTRFTGIARQIADATNAAIDPNCVQATDVPEETLPYGDSWIVTIPKAKARLVSDAFGLGEDGIAAAREVWRRYQGGNFWSPYDAFLAFCKYEAKIDMDFSKWTPWETLCLHSSVRIVHEEFCMIADRPTVLKQDSQRRPHCETGPFAKWRDGSQLFAIHNVHMPAKYVMTEPEKLTADDVLREQNAEVRRELIRRIGVERFLEKAKHKVLDKLTLYGVWDREKSVWNWVTTPVRKGRTKTLPYELLSVELSAEVPDARYLKMINPSIGTWHVEGVHPSCNTCQEAINWRRHQTKDKQWTPSQLT